MSETGFIHTIKRLGENGYVSAEDVQTLRRFVFADGSICLAEVDALFGLADKAPRGDQIWSEYFTEACADFAFSQNAENIVDPNTFVTLKTLATRSSETVNGMVLEMFVSLCDRATAIPAAFSGFIVDQFKRHISGKPGGPQIDAMDTALIERFIFARGTDDNVAITRGEASFLFDLADISADQQNDPAWGVLFKRAVTNHLMAHIGYVRSAPTTVDRQGFFKSFFSRLMSPRNILDADYKQLNETRSNEANAAARITEDESDWLAERIGRDGVFSAEERELLAHMKTLGAELPTPLQDLVRMGA